MSLVLASGRSFILIDQCPPWCRIVWSPHSSICKKHTKYKERKPQIRHLKLNLTYDWGRSVRSSQKDPITSRERRVSFLLPPLGASVHHQGEMPWPIGPIPSIGCDRSTSSPIRIFDVRLLQPPSDRCHILQVIHDPTRITVYMFCTVGVTCPRFPSYVWYPTFSPHKRRGSKPGMCCVLFTSLGDKMDPLTKNFSKGGVSLSIPVGGDKNFFAPSFLFNVLLASKISLARSLRMKGIAGFYFVCRVPRTILFAPIYSPTGIPLMTCWRCNIVWPAVDFLYVIG